jgi:hypothetical protein
MPVKGKQNFIICDKKCTLIFSRHYFQFSQLHSEVLNWQAAGTLLRDVCAQLQFITQTRLARSHN